MEINSPEDAFTVTCQRHCCVPPSRVKGGETRCFGALNTFPFDFAEAATCSAHDVRDILGNIMFKTYQLQLGIEILPMQVMGSMKAL
jgi:hypothetical protein